MKMKFIDLLESVKNDPEYSTIFVGSKGGSCFWFVGSPEELISRLDEFTKYHRQILNCRLYKVVSQRTTFINSLARAEEYLADENNYKDYLYAKEVVETESPETVGKKVYYRMRVLKDKYELEQRIAAGYKDKIYKTVTYQLNIVNKIYKYKSMADRSVIEVYPREIYQDGMIVNIEGYEEGPYWDKDEFEQFGRGIIYDENGKCLYANRLQ